ncbi:putative SWI/SNF-related matrix-associated actin-dependent regulator of chromatin subfamily A member 3-like 1 [Madurella mycetomatis]|uniref:Putative SWI/SNF-related matrix-associated actin-dependent regulator of chromatin subfamily A member 3-like 1 n=1 Tax=Madurella mycetomatis TaxID=100816 RepID=A0A175VPE5_9PEZI|nr:putative SWI/SNF-related matrix-associated actin-dependent regulator of chromatin subfamily A member 3-like 1 [Madurella mycetomatis]KXX73396.1 putative SWI/SNF-related matrix-associated actin-dependent regulator of chromatin subfamily A member 3-like 1 [Madurella mycetomatis]
MGHPYQPSYLRDYRKLTTLHVNVVNWVTNMHLRRKLIESVPLHVREKYDQFATVNYKWDEFQGWLSKGLGYNSQEHAILFAPYGIGDLGTSILDDAEDWEATLSDIAENYLVVADYTDLFFLVVPRGELAREPFTDSFDAWYSYWCPGGVVEADLPPSPAATDAGDGLLEAPEVIVQPRALNKLEASGAIRQPSRRDGAQGPKVITQLTFPDDPNVPEPVVPPATSTSLSSDLSKHPERQPLPTSSNNVGNPNLQIPGRGALSNTGTGIEGVDDDEGNQNRISKNDQLNGVTSDFHVSHICEEVAQHHLQSGSDDNSRILFGLLFREHCSNQVTHVHQSTTRLFSVPFTYQNPFTSQLTIASAGLSHQGPLFNSGSLIRLWDPYINYPVPSGDKRREFGETHYPCPSQSSRDSPHIDDPLDIVDMLATEYQIADTEDDDYGAIDLNVIDTYVPSYNTGDNEKEWQNCLGFFNMNMAEYHKREALAGKTTGRKRVPIKKLPGMSVGLFDYQLMGILNLLKSIISDVSGGMLCDEQGLGKTQEMYGVMVLAYGLRRCKAEVIAAWKKRDPKSTKIRHNARGAYARACPYDERYGFKCYCYSEFTRELADRLPDGPNIVVAPARNCASMVRDAKTKLDLKQVKIRGYHDGSDREDKLTPADVKALRATITAQADGSIEYLYQPASGQSDYIIFVSPEYINRLNAEFNVDVKASHSAAPGRKKSALLPGMVLMDEFHEYIHTRDGGNSRTVLWLQHLKKCSLDSQLMPPLMYFVSGTPFGETPADIRPAICLFERDAWSDDSHPLNGATLAKFDGLTRAFDELTALQASGATAPSEDVREYRRGLNRIFNNMMVRRLGTDKFQNRNLTDIGPLKVNITDHQLPPAVIGRLQSLADQTRELAAEAAAGGGQDVSQFLRSSAGQNSLLKLRLASTFPGIASSPAAANLTFSLAEILRYLTSSRGNLADTPYYRHIPAWSANSSKLETISKTALVMLADKSRIEGEAAHSKKYCIFCPLEAEAMLLYGYLLLKKAKDKRLKPVWIHSAMTQSERQGVIDAFLVQGNAPPNMLVAPMSLAGTGLNLQRAKYSTVTSPAWTKRENQQAYYRIHRVGQRQETKLQLLTCRWNPAERIILGKYEGKEVQGDDEEMWEVSNRFCGTERRDWWIGTKRPPQVRSRTPS